MKNQRDRSRWANVLIGAVLAGAVVIGWTQLANSEASSGPDRRDVIRNDLGWVSVSSEDSDHVGWVDERREPAWVELRDDAKPGETVTIGYQVVLDDDGRPIGHLGPQGYVPGGVTPDGGFTDEGRAQVERSDSVESVSAE